MLNTSEKSFSINFALIVIAELICGSDSNLTTIHYFTKPAIVISLLVFFLLQGKKLNRRIKVLTILALAFSLFGDIALMFDDHNPTYFIIGLASFLWAHIMYIFVFLKHRNKAKNPLGFSILLLCYAAPVFYLLKDRLNDMLIPVSLYMIVILSMATTAFLRHNMVNRKSFIWVFIGAILFLLSDSILAINKFYQPMSLSHIGIMVTYALAQYCIIIGILKLQPNVR